ncbi:MAG: permease, partial [Bacteroidales bacterium]|nr:permease [Bacteroidales bacterium]
MLQRFADWLAYGVLSLDAQSRLGSAVDFFIYDTIKILILLFIISSIMGVINAYFPIERLRNYLTKHKLYGLQYLFASFFGA